MKTTSNMMLVSAVLMSACASPSEHYFSLQPTGLSHAALQAPRLALDILPVSLPIETDRPEWIVRFQDGSIGVLSSKRWAAPLGEELQSALATQLADETRMRLPDASSAPDLPRLRLKLTIQRFDFAPGQATHIVANWSMGAPNRPYLYCPLNFEGAAASSDMAALANIRAWQKALARQIAQAILAFDSNGSIKPGCASPGNRATAPDGGSGISAAPFGSPPA